MPDGTLLNISKDYEKCMHDHGDRRHECFNRYLSVVTPV